MPNRLAQESSPYLLQHANNPVDWYPWGKEALAKARAENKPVFLSIGYSACHWCHVMERESFENEKTAAIMNEHFVNIKVDREERPDLDSIYMDAVVMMTGQGGWPMSVFLTPEGAPFYGGTYYPPTPRHGLPSFEQVLVSISRAYHNRAEDVKNNGQALIARIQGGIPLNKGNPLQVDVLDAAVLNMGRNFDMVHGGFGGAPKFPQPAIFDFLLRSSYRTQNPHTLRFIELTLLKMAHGGMYDQLGGGFHRYSVDAVWLVPHFEKMLYDNALLARVYLHAYQLTAKPFYRKIVEETLDYVVREMTGPGGGFYSTQDADSEGEEGRFFLWTTEAVQALLGRKDAEVFCAAYNVQPGGNFEGQSILNIPTPLERIAAEFNLSLAALNDLLQRSKAKLFAAREQRIKPERDEKILTAWNGMMLAAFAEAARVLDRDDYRAVAVCNAEFILSTMLENGRFYRTWKAEAGQAKLMGYLEDYAFYADGLLALYQTTFNPRWFRQARSLMDTVLKHFADDKNGGFFDTADDHENLVIRPKGLQDSATPCGNSTAARVLLALAGFTGENRYREAGITALAALQGAMGQYPAAFSYWLGTMEYALASTKEIAIIGPVNHSVTRQMLDAIQKPYAPNQVVAVAEENKTADHPELLQSRPAQNGLPTAYVCQNFTCRQPVTTTEALEEFLAEL